MATMNASLAKRPLGSSPIRRRTCSTISGTGPTSVFDRSGRAGLTPLLARQGRGDSVGNCRIQIAALLAGFMAAAGPVHAAGIHLDVALGDVSLQKVPFIIAADAGLYEQNGLDVHQFIT